VAVAGQQSASGRESMRLEDRCIFSACSHGSGRWKRAHHAQAIVHQYEPDPPPSALAGTSSYEGDEVLDGKEIVEKASIDEVVGVVGWL
jgi:hypothetical protein